MANMNITEVRLLSVPLENDYKHTFYFSNAAEQEAYFKNRASFTDDDFSYQRKDKKIRYHRDYDAIAWCNYVMYRNTAKSNKWYYAFITKIEYVSDGKSDIYIETDVLQTWMFDYDVKASFIEREHTNNDTVGANTVPENLETGEYIANRVPKYDILATCEKAIIFAVTKQPDGSNISGQEQGGVYSGLGYRYVLPKYDQLTWENASALVQSYADAGYSDAIQSIFICPTFLFSVGENGSLINNNPGAETWDTDLGAAPTAIDGYTPKNNKLFCFPYTYLYLTNQQGAGAIYHNEKFYTGERKFRGYGVVTPGCSIRTMPLNYNNIPINSDEGVNLGKFPICNWNSDVYTNWLTQNSVNQNVSMLGGGLSLVGGAAMAATGNVVGGLALAAGGLGTIYNTIRADHEHSFIPPQAQGNINCGDAVFSAGQNAFKWVDMSIKAEYARIIDDYFSMFGYKTNRVKEPNKAHRAEYWYTKTIDVNIDGAIPMDDMQKIKNCYNTGLTFWRNPANIQDYSVNNYIL